MKLTSPGQMTEPFLTFLVEASWPGGRLLREYTVLLDPPTYVPPTVQQAPAVTAPVVSQPADTGRIERPAVTPSTDTPPVSRPQPVTPPRPQPAPPRRQQPTVPADTSSYDTQGAGTYVVQRGETLWGIASRMRPDNRLSMNQTMLAIYEANPGAFAGNINLLKAGATMRIPSADEFFQISRGDAFSEVQRQNTNWQSGVTDDVATRAETRPSLTLVPPDEEPAGVAYDDEPETTEVLTREQEVEKLIADLEAADVPRQQSLIEIRDNELANLRRELANIRGEVYEPPVTAAGDDPFVDDSIEAAPVDAVADDVSVSEDTETDAVVADDATAETPAVVRTPSVSKPGVIERIMGAISGFWGAIIAAVVLLAGLFFWVARRQSGEVSDSGPWQPLDRDDADVTADDDFAETTAIAAPVRGDDDAIQVVEGDSGVQPMPEETIAIPIVDEPEEGATTEYTSIEDTFSSDTAVNLDQTDPVAEADFHMAYGLYDQAADLINGALEIDPTDSTLLSKLCEVYFVWGNRDAFVDAAGRLKSSLGEQPGSEWDKIVIMGQQIAADDAMFADSDLTAATQAVDLSLETDSDEAGALDMDFGSSDEESSTSDSVIIDLGADIEGRFADMGDEAADDDLELTVETTAEMPQIDPTNTMETVEMPSPDDSAGASPGEPSVDGGDDTSPAATAEINLDELDLDIDQLAATELASLDDLDDLEDLDDGDIFGETGMPGSFDDFEAPAGTSEQSEPDSEATDADVLDLEALIKPDDTAAMHLAKDDTGSVPAVHDDDDAADVDIEDDFMEATGLTQILDDDATVQAPARGEVVLGDDEATMQLPAEGGEFEFAKTGALASGSFDVDEALDETGEMPAVAETDVDLDLDDLTAALKINEMGDPADEIFDENTAEQPSPSLADTAEIPTMSLAPDEMGDDLHEARTMTEVGTKLDLARAYVDMGDPAGARSILEEVLDEGDDSQRQQAQQLLDSLPG
ncbi:MAG: LysM peptidoglycan-binding domain-containing protein [Gammaproteobacteria bacterium]|nr:LysM peptidoglycan-binding domain-containing protein [Gammaproteobacteria bacterium]